MKKLFGLILFCFIFYFRADATPGSDVFENNLFKIDEVNVVPNVAIDNQLIKVDSFDVNIIPPSSGVQFYKDGLIYLSRSKNFSKMVPVHISFGTTQAYYAVLQDSILVNPQVFVPAFTFSYPCDALSFTGDFNTMYYTKLGKKDISEKIYQTNYSSGGWKDSPSPMSFCTGSSTFTHPAVSTDGKILIFASDRTNSIGGMDLFITRKDGEQWSPPENMGKLINTTSNELFPSLDSENNLYFSSDGHPGFGGYDVFVCKFNGKKWEEPYNLTKRINSTNNDVAFKVNRKSNHEAFFTTIENTKNKNAQLYKVTFNNLFATDSIKNLSAGLLNMAQSDMTFPHKKLIAELVEPEVKKEPVKPPEVKKEEVKPPEVKKEEVKPPEVKKEPVKPPEVQKEPPKPRADTIKVITQVRQELKDVVVYRVQFLSSAKQQSLKQLVVNGKTYSTYIYYYLKEYRYTIGEFTSLGPAKELQFALRKSGYPQAFVAVFKNNIRSLNLSYFLTKEEVKSPEVTKVEATQPDVKKEEVRPAEVKKEEVRPAEVKKEEVAAPVAVKEEAKARVETIELITPLNPELKDVVVYRIQFLSSSKQQSLKPIVVNGKAYSPYIYYYQKLYRYTVGEFTSLELAKEFQLALRKAGYPQTFIVAFKNNVRSSDLSTFK